MDMSKLRAFWWHRQGLDGTLAGADPAEVLARTGWARSVGGANPYLSIFARAGTARATVDAEVKTLRIHELPSARGCTYVLPAEHFALGLQVGRDAPEADLKVLARLGVDRAEIDRLCAAVLTVLGTRTLDPAKLKDELGDAVRSLGEEGRKEGQSTTLPAALGLLQASGAIRRVPTNGRLDQQRYAYTAWDSPATGLTDADARAELAALYFDWIGPASLAHLRWFTAWTAAATKAAIAELELSDLGGGLLATPTVAKEFAAFTPPSKPQYALLAGIDALILLRRDHHALLDPADAARTVPGDAKTLGEQPDLPDHPIVDRGRVIGLWQYDSDADQLATWVFDGKTDKALKDAIARTQSYVANELGDARSFSLDSPKSRAPRITALRQAGQG